MFIFLWEGQKEILRMYVNISGCFHLGPQEVLTVRLSLEDFFFFKHMVWTYYFAFVLYLYSHVTGRFLWEADSENFMQ